MRKKTYTSITFYLIFIFWFIVTQILWVLAFVPDNNSSKFITSAKNICFGSFENGLPDTYGWIKLIITPMIFIITVVIMWYEQFSETIKNIKEKKILKIITILFFIFFLIEVNYFYNNIIQKYEIKKYSLNKKIPLNKGSEYLPDNYPKTNKKIEKFEFVNQSGKIINEDSLKKKITIFTFAFTHCKTICPKLIYTLKKAHNKVKNENIQLIIISIDPWRETVNNLKHSVKQLKLVDNEHYLTGSIEKINDFLNKCNFISSRNENDGDIVHPGIVYILKGKNIIYTFNSPNKEWIISSINKLKLN